MVAVSRWEMILEIFDKKILECEEACSKDQPPWLPKSRRIKGFCNRAVREGDSV